MRAVLTRAALLVVGQALAWALLLLVVVGAWLFVVSAGDWDQAWDRLRSATVLAFVAGGMAVAAILAAGTAYMLARRLCDRVTLPLDELGHRAELVGHAHVTQATPIDSGIPEIDRLDRALAKGSQQAASRLAAERSFAADASHQLRTPLTALLIRLEEIAVATDFAIVAEESAIAISQVERLSQTVTELMARSRGGEEVTSGISLDTVLAALMREWQPALSAARRSIRVHGERGLEVRAAPVALAQIFSVLVENSMAHGRGVISISCRRTGPSVVVEVSDQGRGIDPAIAPRIFERRVSSKGSGLGLALARDLAEADGGRLELVSAAPAMFALFLSAASDSD